MYFVCFLTCFVNFLGVVLYNVILNLVLHYFVAFYWSLLKICYLV